MCASRPALSSARTSPGAKNSPPRSWTASTCAKPCATGTPAICTSRRFPPRGETSMSSSSCSTPRPIRSSTPGARCGSPSTTRNRPSASTPPRSRRTSSAPASRNRPTGARSSSTRRVLSRMSGATRALTTRGRLRSALSPGHATTPRKKSSPSSARARPPRAGVRSPGATASNSSTSPSGASRGRPSSASAASTS